MPPTIARPRRVLFCTLSGYGHVFPMFPLAAAARDAGHEVIFATGPEAGPAVARAGFAATPPVGISIPAAFSELAGGTPVMDIPEPIRLEMAGPVFAEVLPRHTIHDLTPICAELAPDLIVYGQWEQGAFAVATAAGIPAVEFRVSRPFPGEDSLKALPPAAISREALLAAQGFPGAAPEQFLDIYPPSLQERRILDDPSRMPLRPVAWSDPGAGVPDWVRAERPRPLVYLTLGTTPNEVHALEIALAGLTKHDVDVLVALGQLPADSLPTSDRVHLARWVDQAEVLRHVDLVVHHGGSGTTLGAAAAGLPQLVLPQRADQFDNAGIVASSGIGRTLLPGDVTPEAVTEAVDALGSAEHRRATAATRDEILAMPTPAQVLPQVLAAAESGEMSLPN